MEGCTVIPIMTLGFQNCDLFFDKVFTDEIEQIRGFKYFDKFKSVSNTTDVLAGKRLGRENDKERILVYYYGLAVHDLYFATKILEKSENLGDMEYRYCKERYFV
jgi:ornithine cyclodeaminase/alanine dehydrogenase-like protein (mu-crystallin family)